MIIPNPDWLKTAPEDVHIDGHALEDIHNWMQTNAALDQYRVAIVRDGYLVAEWYHGVSRDNHQRLASATKSIFSSMLGILIGEGAIPSADTPVIELYPEAMDVPPGTGPKPGRHVFEKDHAITLRQLISNTSGYMKPDEEPGKVFHYQTYGMNILTHAMAQVFGLYDINNPEAEPGFKSLINEKLRDPIGASWSYYQANFDLQPEARINIFGYYDGINATARDMARLGWLWCNKGQWGDQQIIPAAWIKEATQTAPMIRENCPQDQWQYGYGFWVNDHGVLWPDLPREGYMAAGAGHQYICVFPPQNLVIVLSPAPFDRKTDPRFAELLGKIIATCK